jgi:nitrite reductase/ring-hydroxylating ferredoxin subunit
VNTEECSVVCPWHYGKFDLRTGAALDGLVRKPVETYAVEVRDGMICVGTQVSTQASAPTADHSSNGSASPR